MEGDNCSHRVTLQNVHFNPLPPYGGRPERRCLAMKRFKFQSTPSVWRETFCSSAFRDTLSFQSTPSAWRETVQLLHLDMSVIFQSTPSAWRETHAIVRVDAPNYISIHSLRMEGDPVSSGKTIRQSISIHSLRMEGDEMSTVSEYVGEVFQSTPSAWRETIMYFVSKMEKLISIHSLRMEGDAKPPAA